MPACVSLLQRFGRECRVTFDPAYDHRHVPRDRLDPWMLQLPCARGVIYPHGGELLAAEVDYRAPTFKALLAIPGVKLHQDGDHEKTLVFHVDLSPQVAAILKPRRRRVLTDERKAALSLAGEQTRFSGPRIERQTDDPGTGRHPVYPRADRAS